MFHLPTSATDYSDPHLERLQQWNLRPNGAFQVSFENFIDNHPEAILQEKFERNGGKILVACKATAMTYFRLSMTEEALTNFKQFFNNISEPGFRILARLSFPSILLASDRLFCIAPSKEGRDRIAEIETYYCSHWLCYTGKDDIFVGLDDDGPRARTLEEWKAVFACCWQEILDKKRNPTGDNTEQIRELGKELNLNKAESWNLCVQYLFVTTTCIRTYNFDVDPSFIGTTQFNDGLRFIDLEDLR